MFEKSKYGVVAHTVTTNNALCDKETGRVVAVFCNEYDLNAVLDMSERVVDMSDYENKTKELIELAGKMQAIVDELKKVSEPEVDKVEFLEEGYHVDSSGIVCLGGGMLVDAMVGRGLYNATEDQAREIDAIITRQRKIYQISRQLSPDWVADWGDNDQRKSFLYFHSSNGWESDITITNNDLHVYFDPKIEGQMLDLAKAGMFDV